jgi:putative cell wall-binding protein
VGNPGAWSSCRHEGPDRYKPTSCRGSALAVFEQGRTAVLASGETHADGLVAQALAGSIDGGAPFLLTPRSRPAAATLAALRDLAVTDVVIVGDPTAVSDDVQRALQDTGIRVSRLEGPTRVETALAVARTLTPSSVLVVDGSDERLVAVAPIAYARSWPVLYSSSGRLSDATMSFLTGSGARALVVPTGADATGVTAQLTDAGIVVDEVGVATQDPAGAVPAYAVGSLAWTPSRLVLSADDYPDALSAAQLAARDRAPLLLTGDPGRLSAAARTALADWPTDVSELLVVGDETTVTPDVVAATSDLVGRPR